MTRRTRWKHPASHDKKTMLMHSMEAPEPAKMSHNSTLILLYNTFNFTFLNITTNTDTVRIGTTC